MKIGILSFRPEAKKASVEELDLKKEAKLRGHKARIFRAHRFQMAYNCDSPWILYDGKPFPKYDAIITRPSILTNISLHVTLIEQLEMFTVVLFNRFDAVMRAKNKIKTMQILNHYGIPIPSTVIIRRQEDLAQAVKLAGGFPVILKQAVGSFGAGVTIVESMRALKSFLLWEMPMYILQQYVKYSRGKDIRIFVINGKVVGCMMRSAKKGEFRANIELGAKGTSVDITEEEAHIALRSVQALDLDYAGVDIMRSENGPVVLEVNSNPGFKELERASGVNISGALIEYAEEMVNNQKTQFLN